MNRPLLATLSLTTVLLSTVAAHAGKVERDFLASDVDPAVKESESKFKTACGCALKITINENSKKEKYDLQLAKFIIDGVKDGAASFCTDAASKKALCQMKSLDVAKDPELKFTFKEAKGVVTHNGTSYAAWEMITKELDK